MRHRFRMVVVVALMATSACSTEAGREEIADQALFHGRAECSRLFADAALAPIRNRVALGILEQLPPQAEQLSDPIREEDKPILEIWLADRELCWAAFATSRTLEPRVFTDMLTASYVLETALIAELYVGRLTYRQFAAERAQLAAATRQTSMLLETAGTRLRQRQLSDEFVSDARKELDSEAMAKALAQMRAAMLDPSKCHIGGDSRCI